MRFPYPHSTLAEVQEREQLLALMRSDKLTWQQHRRLNDLLRVAYCPPRDDPPETVA